MSEETTTITPPPAETPGAETAPTPPAPSESNSLEDNLSKQTQFKEPSAVASLADSPGFWGDDEAEEPAESSNKEKSGQSNEPSAPTPSKEAFRTSARTGVLLLDNVQKLAFTFLVNRKYSRKFTEQEWSRIDQIIELDRSKVSDDDLPLYGKAQKVMKRWAKKTEDIPMKEKERKDLEEQLYEYCKMTGKTLSPNLILGLTLLNSMGSRAIDLITE